MVKQVFKHYVPGVFEKKDLEAQILEIIGSRPASVDVISRLTGIPTDKICHEVSRLEKWKAVKVVSKREMRIYAIGKNGGGSDGNR